MIPRLVDIPPLETERLTFRAPEASDFDAFLAFSLSDRAAFVGGGPDKDVGYAWRVLASITGHWHLRGFGCFAVVRKDTGTLVGTMGPWRPEPYPENELSWTVWDPASEGKGYAFEAMVEIRRYAYDVLGWDTAVSYIDAANARSIALAKRMGCVIDTDAQRPHPDDVVYRHPSAEEVLA